MFDIRIEPSTKLQDNTKLTPKATPVRRTRKMDHVIVRMDKRVKKRHAVPGDHYKISDRGDGFCVEYVDGVSGAYVAIDAYGLDSPGAVLTPDDIQNAIDACDRRLHGAGQTRSYTTDHDFETARKTAKWISF